MIGRGYTATDSLIVFTPEGGIGLKLINNTGEVSVKGKLVKNSADFDMAVKLCPLGEPSAIGVIYDSGVAIGELMTVVFSGFADVLFGSSVVRGGYVRTINSGETGAGAGIAIAEPFPTQPFATDKHFQEVGHSMQSRTGAGLARVNLHFN